MFKLTLGFILFTLTMVLRVNATSSNIIALDNLVTQWTQLEQQHSEISNRWREKKPLLQQQLQLLKEERVQLQTILEQHAKSSDEVVKERFDLLQKQTQMERIQQLMEADLAKISSVLISLHKQLPPPLKKQWNIQITLLSGDEKSLGNISILKENKSFQATDNLLNNSEKLDTLLSLLNQIEKFEQRIALHQTTMQLINTSTESETIEIQVDQVYLGLSQGWYISKDGKYWGTGNTSIQGWQWQHQNADVDVSELRLTIDMLTKPITAVLVALPIKLSSKQETAK